MRRQAPLIAAGAGLLIAILVTVALVIPKRSAIGSAKTDLQDAKVMTVQLQNSVAQYLFYQSQEAANSAAIAATGREIPPDVELPGILRQFQAVTNNTGGIVSSLSIGTGTPGATFTIVPLSASYTGTQDQLAAFVWSLEHLPRASKITSLTITPNGSELSATINMEVYTSDLQTGPGSQPGTQSVAGG